MKTERGNRRWPGWPAAVTLFAVASLTVAGDGLLSSKAGILAQPPPYDGVSYMLVAEGAYRELLGGHWGAAALTLLQGRVPLWESLFVVHWLVFGQGYWQAFSVRVWPVWLILLLVFWLTSRRAGPRTGMAIALLVAVTPLVTPGLRASVYEYATGTAHFQYHWFLDDLRPDLLGAALGAWVIAVLVELRTGITWAAVRFAAIVGAFTVLAKPSTAFIVLIEGIACFAVFRLVPLRTPEARIGLAPKSYALTALIFVTILLPWIVVGGVSDTVAYLYQNSTTFKAAYQAPPGLAQTVSYYVTVLPDLLGWTGLGLAALAVAAALLRRTLTLTDGGHAVPAFLAYALLSTAAGKNPQVGFYVAIPLLLVSCCAAARLASGVEWTVPLASVVTFAEVAFLVLVAGLAWFDVSRWPASETMAYAREKVVMSQLTAELERRLSKHDCFTAFPGPGTPAVVQYMLLTDDGLAVDSSAIDVDPAWSQDTYVQLAARCQAVIVFREDPRVVDEVYFAPPVRQPYLRALASWVREPQSGYRLDRSWHLDGIPSYGTYRLGHSSTPSLTLELFVRAT